MVLIAAEDMLMFVNAAITSSGQREFHSSAQEQQLSLGFLHEYMIGNYRDLYAATLALDINDHNAVLIAHRLLATPGDTDLEQRRLEGALIGRRLCLVAPQQVYRLLRGLRQSRVNNRRTRAIVRDWLAHRPDPAFDAVKYRSQLKRALRHTHPEPSDSELGDFLFGGRPRYETPILETWRRAHYEQASVYELPYTVAEGFAAKHKIDRSTFLERIAPRMTRGEQLRTQATAERNDAGIAVDLTRMPLTRLASYALSLPLSERAGRRTELTGALRAAAARVAGRDAGRWGRVVAVLDDSFSTYGSGQKRRRPLAVALACSLLFEALADTYVPLWTSGRTDALLAYPYGVTALGERVLDGLDHGPDRLLIVSDGWDNAPAGMAAEVLRVWRTRLDPEHKVSVVHLNPVYDAGTFDVKGLGHVPTVGVRDAEDVPALVEFARFTEGRAGLADLRAHFDDRVSRFLEG
ncbi:hypothetical protein [Kibdelosporangium phytohabitans]|uniref:TROVE domain-containing protein n=1 Tax=Kibdelosporangium phytohabitans TaxID=860235 RepID=A0A0N9HU86_9PSEU|nr:hypothetical protein [Kibdelosporangium phytohabitans]ALG08755.1 hypothetical protein AOZ06_19165 [Kibdelosporangium phytohabitans]MBE1470127.1 hypothetical protein [Kibdelosporangium phytohabitans]